MQSFIDVLAKSGMGWMGVFIVTIVIILVVEGLNRFTGGDK